MIANLQAEVAVFMVWVNQYRQQLMRAKPGIQPMLRTRLVFEIIRQVFAKYTDRYDELAVTSDTPNKVCILSKSVKE